MIESCIKIKTIKCIDPQTGIELLITCPYPVNEKIGKRGKNSDLELDMLHFAAESVEYLLRQLICTESS